MEESIEERLREEFPGIIEKIEYNNGVMEISLVDGRTIYVSPVTEEKAREMIDKVISEKELSFPVIETIEVREDGRIIPGIEVPNQEGSD